jgi:probable phosphoglycerate mutase
MAEFSLVHPLKNRYFIMRHGESMPNILGIVLSHHVAGKAQKFGLSERGRLQAQQSAEDCAFLDKDTVIYSSDFSRARETAEIARRVFHAAPIHLTTRLRERFFGQYEEKSNAHYHDVWAQDRQSPRPHQGSVESVEHVLARAMALISSLEKKYKGKKILLVSHGDTLQILSAGFRGRDPSLHRDERHLEVAEIRELVWKGIQ